MQTGPACCVSWIVIVSMVAIAKSMRYGNAKTLAVVGGGGTGDMAGVGRDSVGEAGEGKWT